MPELAEWDSFYVIVGSAAGALIGLQFVVVTLIAERPSLRTVEAGAAFATPTIVHFGAALLLSALLRAPWHTIIMAAALWGVMGVGGVVYAAIVPGVCGCRPCTNLSSRTGCFTFCCRWAAYAMLALSAFAASAAPRGALFAVAAAALLLLFIAIHNAWDSIAYHVFVSRRDRDRKGRGDDTSKKDAL